MIKNENYIQISGWMVNDLNLNGNELMVYALIHGFSQDGKSVFKGSIAYIQEWLNCGSRQTVINVVKRLVEKKLVEKKILYNANEVVGCEYWTVISRQKNRQDISAAKNSLPRQADSLKNGLPPVQNLDNPSLKNGLPPSPKFGHNILNLNSSDNDVVKICCENIFGKDFFESGFNKKAADFILQNKIDDDNVEEYFMFVKNMVAQKYPPEKINAGLYYKFFFAPDIVKKFKGKQTADLLEKQSERLKSENEEKRKVVCPVCSERFLPGYSGSCPKCDFGLADFGNKDRIARHKKYISLDENRRELYDAELRSFKSDLPILARLAYFVSPQGKEERVKFIASLDKKYGFG